MNNNLGQNIVRDKNIVRPTETKSPLPNGYYVGHRQRGPLVPVGLANRDKSLAFRPGWYHQPGLKAVVPVRPTGRDWCWNLDPVFKRNQD